MSGFGSNTNPSNPLFGGTNNDATSGQAAPSLFGNTANKPTGSSFFNLGGNSTTTTNTQPSGGVFGASATNATPSATSNPLFGGANTATPAAAPATSAFGGGTTSNPLMAGFAKSAANTTTGTQPAPPLFGQASTPVAKSPSMFAQPSAGATGGTPATSSIFGQPATPSATPATGGLFGAKPATAAPAASSSTTPVTGGLFGQTASTSTATNTTAPAMDGLFGTKPATPAPAAAAPTSGNTGFFRQPAAVPTAGTAPATGGLFGSKPGTPVLGTSAPAASTPTTSAPGSGGTGLFGQPATGAATGTSAAPTTGGLFGTNTATSVPGATASGASTPAAGATAASTSTGTPGTGLFGTVPAGGSLFGAKPVEKKDSPAATPTPLFGASKPDEKKEAPAAPAATGTLSIFGAAKTGEKKDDAASAGKRATTPAADTISAPLVTATPPSVLRGKTIEEIVNRWTADLDAQVKEFNKFATEIAVWDRAIMENGNNLSGIANQVLNAERDQLEIEQSLDTIEQHQASLSAMLDTYEKSSQELLGGPNGSLRALDTGPADSERDKSYMLASDLHANLDDLTGSLVQMIESVNSLELNDSAEAKDDPMAQIAQILSNHLESLQWIDTSVRDVEGKVTEIERRIKRESGVDPSHLGKSRGYGMR